MGLDQEAVKAELESLLHKPVVVSEGIVVAEDGTSSANSEAPSSRAASTTFDLQVDPEVYRPILELVAEHTAGKNYLLVNAFRYLFFVVVIAAGRGRVEVLQLRVTNASKIVDSGTVESGSAASARGNKDSKYTAAMLSSLSVVPDLVEGSSSDDDCVLVGEKGAKESIGNQATVFSKAVQSAACSTVADSTMNTAVESRNKQSIGKKSKKAKRLEKEELKERAEKNKQHQERVQERVQKKIELQLQTEPKTERATTQLVASDTVPDISTVTDGTNAKSCNTCGGQFVDSKDYREHFR